jgi:hypothetical protein
MPFHKPRHWLFGLMDSRYSLSAQATRRWLPERRGYLEIAYNRPEPVSSLFSFLPRFSLIFRPGTVTLIARFLKDLNGEEPDSHLP